MKCLKKQCSMELDLSGEVETILSAHLLQICGFQHARVALEKKLELYRDSVQKEQKNNEFLDTDLYIAIELASNTFIKLCEEYPDESWVPFCLAAVSYVVDDNDAVPDFSNITGWDDDAHVLNAVINQFNLKKHFEKSTLHALANAGEKK